jgi:hypothetical protein
MTVSMLADFAVRLAFGLAVSLLAIGWRAVPPLFFRTGGHVMLGLLVLAALDLMRASGQTAFFWCVVAAGVLAYLSAVGWGLGLPKVGLVSSGLIVFASAGWLALASSAPSIGLSLFNAASRLASGLVLGGAFLAMLLGHYYLTAPAMSIAPLKRAVAFLACGLAMRGALAAVGLCLLRDVSGAPALAHLGGHPGVFLAARWGLGFLGAAIATYLTWKTVEIRSTQSATGILYIAIIFVLFGELTSLILARGGGVIC